MQEHIESLRKKLKKTKSQAFFVSNFFSIFYLSGIKTLTPEEREAFILITQQQLYFFTDARYLSKELLQKIKEMGGVFKRIEVGKTVMDHLDEIAKTDNIQTIAFEEEDLKFSEYSSLMKLNIELVPERAFVTEIREQKTPEEVELIRKASELSDQCLVELLPIVKIGITEKELAWKMEQWMREKGYEQAFEPIVAIDANSAVPHYDTKRGNNQKLCDGSVLLLDYGVQYESYNSDITRMIFMGKQPTDIMNAYQGLREAQEKTVQFVQKTKELKEVDLFCRSVLKKNGFSDFPHSTGHGVGIEVHESPKVSFKSGDKVKPFQIFTIEPGIYFPGKWGMRIEDTVFINEKNGAESFTTFPKKYLQL